MTSILLMIHVLLQPTTSTSQGMTAAELAVELLGWICVIAYLVLLGSPIIYALYLYYRMVHPVKDKDEQ